MLDLARDIFQLQLCLPGFPNLSGVLSLAPFLTHLLLLGRDLESCELFALGFDVESPLCELAIFGGLDLGQHVHLIQLVQLFDRLVVRLLLFVSELGATRSFGHLGGSSIVVLGLALGLDLLLERLQ